MTAKKYPREKWPAEVRHFEEIQKRVAAGKATTSWSRDEKGFLAFLKCVGPIPIGMIRPTVGRKNHKTGYSKGNCCWQSLSENTREMAIRTWTENYGEMYDARITNKGRRMSEEQKEKIRSALVGKPFTKERRENLSKARKRLPKKLLSELGKRARSFVGKTTFRAGKVNEERQK